MGIAQTAEVIEVNRKILVLVLAFALIMVTSAVGPVMALGPLHAAEVGHNPHLISPFPGIAFMEPGENTFSWVTPTGVIQRDVVASVGAGRMNNALIADHNDVLAMQAGSPVYSNKWIYLSGETSGNQYNGHGMFYWWLLPVFGPTYSLIITGQHPGGVFFTMNSVGK